MNGTIRITPWQDGHARGSTSNSFLSRAAQRRAASVGANLGAGTIAGGATTVAGSACRRWAVPVTLAASAALVTLMAWQYRQETGRLRAEVDRLLVQVTSTNAQLTATLDTLSVIRSATRVMQARLALAGERAGLVVFEDAQTQRWTVVVYGLPAAPAGERFALWCICEQGMREGTSLPESLNGTAVLVVDMPQDLGAILSASITREMVPATAGAMPTKKMELLNLKL